MVPVKKRQFLILFLLSFCLSSIYGSSTFPESRVQNSLKKQDGLKTEIFEIAPIPVFCEQIVPRKCLFVKREGESKFRALWDTIENFDFIEGYKYLLKVEIEKINYPPKDTSGFKYYLKEIIKREKVELSDSQFFLPQSKWFLTSIGGEQIPAGKPFLVFNPEENTFFGNTGCNSMSGQFQLENDRISFSKINQTKRACPNMKSVERPFTAILSKENRIKIEIDRICFYQNEKMVLEFKSNWEN
jgi:heat shock protein HslJ